MPTPIPTPHPTPAKPGLLKTPVHSQRLCTPNLHLTSWSLLPLAKTGVIYLSTAHSSPGDIAENWVSSSWSTAFVVGQEEVTGGSLRHMEELGPGGDAREKLLESRKNI